MTSNELWTGLAVAAGAIKVAATLALANWPGGSASMTLSRAGRLVYWTGKLSPLVLVGALLARAVGEGDTRQAVACAALLVAATVAVIVVTRLRATGRWFGVWHALRTRAGRRSADPS